MRSWFNRLGATALTLLLAACGESGIDAEPTRIGTVQWPGYEPLYLARSLKFFDDKHVRLIEHSATTETIEAYRNDTLDVAALTLDEVLTLREQGVPLQVVLVTDVSNGADVIVGKPQFPTMESLRGKRVGVEANALGAYMLSRSLEKSGMNVSDVEIVPMTFGEHEEGFLKGRVDAVVTFEPVKTKLLNAGGRVVFDSSRIPNEIVDLLIVKPDYLKSHPEQVRKLVAAWFKSLSYMGQHRSEAAELIAGRLGIKPEEYLNSLSGLVIPDLQANKALLDGRKPALLDTVTRLGDTMRKRALLRKPADPTGLIDAGFLP